MIPAATAKAGHLTESVVHLNGATRIFSTQAVQCAANGIEFALNEHGIAPVQVAALNEFFAQGLPFGQVLEVFGGGAELG